MSEKKGIVERIQFLESHGYILWEENDRLKCTPPKNVKLSNADRGFFKDNKVRIINYLKKKNKRYGLDNIYALTSMQQGILFHVLQSEETDQYIVQNQWDYFGELDCELLKKAWKLLLKRHQVFRTKFIWNTIKTPVQAVYTDIELPWYQYDYSDKKSGELEHQLANLAKKDRTKGFNLSNPGLIRFHLIKIAQNHFHFIWTTHHLIIDGWSIAVVRSELHKFYSKLLKNLKYSITADTTFETYLKWLEVQPVNQAKDFWRQELTGYEKPSDLSIFRSRVDLSVTKPIGHLLEDVVKFDECFSRRIETYVARKKITLNTLFQFVWARVLSTLSHNTDVLFGVTVSGRANDVPGIEQGVGLFIHTVPLAVRLDPDAEIEAFLTVLNTKTIELSEHAYLPLTEIQKCSSVPAGQALFYSLFVFENYPQESRLPIELDLDNFKGFDKNSYLLNVIIQPGKEILFKLVGDGDVFHQNDIDDLSSMFRHILASLVTEKVCKIRDIELLSQPALDNHFHKLSNQFFPTTKQGNIVSLFENQVLLHPNKTAIKYKDDQLTYVELNRKANRFSHYIRSLYLERVGDELPENTLIGLLSDRTPTLVVAALGILKAGAAYVPIDPNCPQERIDFIVEDSQLAFLLSDKTGSSNENVIDLSNIEKKLQTASPKNQELNITADSTAYIIYTSGSTGKPKGVSISHFNVVRLFKATKEAFAFDENDTWTLFHSFAFDFSVWEVFGPLLHGGKLIIVPYSISRSPREFRELLIKEKVTMLNQTPSAFELLCGEDLHHLQKIEHLRYIIFGGETLDFSRLNGWFHKYGYDEPTLVNMYGITETTVHVSILKIDKNLMSISSDVSAIGKPLPDMFVLLLDQYGKTVPPYMVGEIHVGGYGLAKGYVNREALTKEKFNLTDYTKKINSHFSEGFQNLYRSGDLGYEDQNGSLYYLGRNDQQIQLKGFRIELGEIEKTIRSFRKIRQAVVTLDSLSQTERLVGYFTSETTIKIQDLRDFLDSKLPPYTIPSILMQIKKIPLTVNGKLDYQALPAAKALVDSTTYESPENEREKILADIWKDLLSLELVSVNDSFFSLGGDSILSIQLVSRARAKGIRLTPRDLFDAPTISLLAKKTLKQPLKKISQLPEQGVAELTPIQQWFFQEEFKNRHHFNQSYLLKYKGKIKVDILESAVNRVTKHHDSLRLRFRSQNGSWQQFYDPEELTRATTVHSMQIDSISAAEQAETIDKICRGWQKKVNIETGPVTVVGVIQGAHDQYDRMFLAVHHLVIDGVSWRILLSDIITAYEQLKNNVPITLPDKTQSFKTWSHALMDYAKSDTVLKSRDYWLGTGNSSPLFPVDNEQYHGVVQRVNHRRFTLSKPLTDKLLHKCSFPYSTEINDLLLSAFALTVFRQTNQDEILFHLEGHGRETIHKEIDTTRTIGWFTSLYPVHLKLPKDKSWSSIIKSVKEQLRAIPQNGLSYSLLRYLSEDCTLKNKLASLDKSRLTFNYLGQMDQMLGDGGLWQFSDESSGNTIDPDNHIPDLLTFNCVVEQGQLKTAISFSQEHFKNETIESLITTYKECLALLIEHCSGTSRRMLTPSDLPSSTLDQVSIETIENLYGKSIISDIYPLTEFQAGLLFQTLNAPQLGQYCVQRCHTFEGQLKVEVFKQAFEKLIQSYPLLKASIVWEGVNQFVQVIHKDIDLKWEEIDLRRYEEAVKKTRLEEILAQDRCSDFELSKPPLMRFHLIRLGKNTYEFIWTMHHILIDGWSTTVLLEHLARDYCQLVQGKSVDFKEDDSFKRYLNWLKTSNTEKAKAFWTEELNGFEAPNDIGIKRVNTQLDLNKPIAELGESSFQLGENLSQTLSDFAQRNNVTVNSIFQFAWACVLSVYSGQSDVVYGSVVSGRSVEIDNIEQAVGVFINAVPIRVKLSADETAMDAIEKINSKVNDYNEFGTLSQLEIQKCSHLPPSSGMFYSVLVFEGQSMGNRVTNYSQHLKIKEIRTYEKGNSPLSVYVIKNKSIYLKVSYDKDCFEWNKIKRLSNHIKVVLQSIIANKSTKIKDISILSSEELKFFAAVNQTDRSFRSDCTLNGLFEEQVGLYPELTALVCHDQHLTYRELDVKANQLANLITRVLTKIRNEDTLENQLVAVCLEKGPDLFIAILAILKSGCAYVPLDPTYPPERLSYILDDSEVELILTSTTIAEELQIKNHPGIATIEMNGFPYKQYSTAKPDIGNNPKNLAYVIYTSGTTGQPKGVMIEHIGVCSLAKCTAAQFHMNPGTRLLQFSSICFDISVQDWALTLLNGGELHILSQAEMPPQKALEDVLYEKKINVVQLPPALWEMMPYKDLPELKTVISGGDACSESIINKWANHGKTFINDYGPTEVTIAIANHICKSGDRPLIGKPYPNTKLYVLDANLNQVPLGVAGELYAAGVGVARGYWKKLDLTKECFIPNQMNNRKKANAHWYSTLYKTGDIVRRNEDGALEYLNRRDRQVKIHGYRIEPGEIEVQLLQHDLVSQSAVKLHQDKKRNVTQLVAYYSANRTIDAKDLQAYLSKKLPEYMIPSLFIELQQLPLNSNGKIDHNALPEPDIKEVIEKEYEPPINQIEKSLATIWQRILKFPKIGTRDNFFVLGGDSLKALRALVRINMDFDCHLSIREFFKSPTISELAATISNRQGASEVTYIEEI